MADGISSVKAIVYFGKKESLKGLERDNKTIQHFDYKCQRSRGVDGEPYGPTVSSLMTFTLRNVISSDSKELYGYLKDATSHDFTFMFDVNFKRVNGKYEHDSHKAAMYVTGYVVDIEEYFGGVKTSNNSEETQMLMEVKLLLSKITYLGEADKDNTSIDESKEGNTLVLLSNK